MIHRQNRPKSVYSDRRVVDAWIEDIPALGYKTLFLRRTPGGQETSTNPFPLGYFPYSPIAKSGNILDNGRLRVTLREGFVDVLDYETGVEAKEVNAFASTGSSGDFWIHREPGPQQHDHLAIRTNPGGTAGKFLSAGHLSDDLHHVCAQGTQRGPDCPVG